MLEELLERVVAMLRRGTGPGVVVIAVLLLILLLHGRMRLWQVLGSVHLDPGARQEFLICIFVRNIPRIMIIVSIHQNSIYHVI